MNQGRSAPAAPAADGAASRSRFVVVVPLLEEIQGNRHALAIAAELARTFDVSVVAWSATRGAVDDARRLAPGVSVEALHLRPPRGRRMSRFLISQFRRRLDREVASYLLRSHQERPIAHILVGGNEGHWLAEYVRAWPGGPAGRPSVSVLILDLVDGVYLLRHNRPYPIIRELLAPLHALLHWCERERLRLFDQRFVNSRWTASLLEALYGWTPDGNLACIDTRTFGPGPVVSEGTSGYLALPTASLGGHDPALARRLRADGVPLVAYGPRSLEGVDYRGFLEEPELVRLLQTARATLFLFDYEALGMIPLESLACGTPVITRPEQGPGLELRGNPGVRFFRTYPELLRACRELLTHPPTVDDRTACRASIEEYTPAHAVATLLARVAA